MVSEGKGRLFRRKDGKYLIYIPLDLAEDSMFPFREHTRVKTGRGRESDSIRVKVSFMSGEQKLLVESSEELSSEPRIARHNLTKVEWEPSLQPNSDFKQKLFPLLTNQLGLDSKQARKIASTIEVEIEKQLCSVWDAKADEETVRMFSTATFFLTKAVITKLTRAAHTGRSPYID